MEERPELTTIELVGGPYCGRELCLDCEAVKSITLEWYGDPAV